MFIDEGLTMNFDFSYSPYLKTAKFFNDVGVTAYDTKKYLSYKPGEKLQILDKPGYLIKIGSLVYLAMQKKHCIVKKIDETGCDIQCIVVAVPICSKTGNVIGGGLQ